MIYMKCIISFHRKLHGLAGIIYVCFHLKLIILIDVCMSHGRKEIFKFDLDILAFYWYKGYMTFAAN